MTLACVENRTDLGEVGSYAKIYHSQGILPQIFFNGQVLQLFCAMQYWKIANKAEISSLFMDFSSFFSFSIIIIAKIFKKCKFWEKIF